MKKIIIIFIIGYSLGNGKTADAESKNLLTSPAPPHFSLSLLLTAEPIFVNDSTDAPPATNDAPVMPHPAVKLLPDRLSMVESAFWGEGGILRWSGIAPLTPSARKNELSYRRTILSMHQIAGFTTLVLFIPTLIYGQRNINMRNTAAEGRGRFDQKLADTHQTLAYATFGTYMFTAALAIFAPPPLIRRNEWSTISTHKTLAIIHFTGMIATPILAVLASRASSYERERSLQKAHQAVAYITAGAFAASMIVVTF